MNNEGKIAAAVGTAVGARRKMGPLIESAMANAVTQIARESEAIAARTDLSNEQKTTQIAALNAPEAVRVRMLAARMSIKQNVGGQ